MTKQEQLLSDLAECRWIIMSQLADEAEERGDDTLAAGWRWLVEKKRWPQTTPRGNYHRWVGYPIGVFTTRGHHAMPNSLLYHSEIRKRHSDLSKLMLTTALAVGAWLKNIKNQ